MNKWVVGCGQGCRIQEWEVEENGEVSADRVACGMIVADGKGVRGCVQGLRCRFSAVSDKRTASGQQTCTSMTAGRI